MTSVVNPARPVAATRAHGVLGASLPYRRGVGIMLINRDGLVWTGRRLPKWSQNKTNYIWQMPQGGIDAGEDPIVAAFRELKEETGIQSAELIAEYPRLLSYDLPDELMGIAAVTAGSSSAGLPCGSWGTIPRSTSAPVAARRRNSTAGGGVT
jgi:8-oxo-dGTP pyrophosphatase MutT (NUDIX family)